MQNQATVAKGLGCDRHCRPGFNQKLGTIVPQIMKSQVGSTDRLGQLVPVLFEGDDGTWGPFALKEQLFRLGIWPHPAHESSGFMAKEKHSWFACLGLLRIPLLIDHPRQFLVTTISSRN